MMAAPTPVCLPPPPGVCVTVCPPGCVCPAVVVDCAPKPVPTLDLLPLGLLVALVIVIAVLMHRAGRKA